MRSDIVLRFESFGGLAVHLPTERELRLNHTAAAMLDRHLAADPEPVASLARRFPDAGPEILARDYAGFVAFFDGWRADRADTPPPRLLDRRAEGPLSAPREVFWEVTWACNLRCAYCYNDSGRGLDDELTTGECLDLIGQWGRAGVLKAVIGGGEPLARRDWRTILAALADHNIIPVLITNATRIDRAAARFLTELPLARVSVSLDGPDDAGNAVTRGPSFAAAAAGIGHLRAAGKRFGIQTTLTRATLDRLEEMAATFHAMGADTWSVRRLLPFGRGGALAGLGLDADQCRQADAALARLRPHYPAGFIPRDRLLPMAFARDDAFAEMPERTGMPLACGPAVSNCGLTPDGRIIACSYLADEEWNGPSVRTAPFLDLWREAGVLARFRALTADMLPRLCRTCSHLGRACAGGCRAKARAVTGDWLATDPDCPYAGAMAP